MRGTCFVVLLAVLSASVSAQAEVPQHFTLNVQVFEPDDPFGFSYPAGPVKVELFDAPDGGNSLWFETHDGVAIDYGFMSVPLGVVNTMKPLPDVLLANAGVPLFLEVTLGGTGEKLPQRIELTSVPFALACSQADEALRLEGKTASAFSLAGHEHVKADITDWPTEFSPEAHQHAWGDLTSGVPKSFPPEAHTHPWTEVTAKPEWLANDAVSWNEVGDKPLEFPSEAHQHAWVDLLDVPAVLADGLVSWSEMQDKPTTFPPAGHDHAGAYLPASGKAVDADMLDGFDGAAYALTANTYLMQESDVKFAKQEETYTKKEVGDAIAAALGPLQTLVEEQTAKLWCLENCDPAKLGDCKERTCDGGEQKCTKGEAQADGTLCQGGGRCLGGECCDWASWGFDCTGDGGPDWTGILCGGVSCPVLAGYTVSCNTKDHCEYANVDSSGWKQWDMWIWIPPGSFPMGSPDNEDGHQSDESPVHTVTLAKGYFIGKYEIVVAQYEACKAANPGKCTAADTTDWSGTQGTNTSGNGKSEHPQNGLTWQQAKDFCAWVVPGGGLPSEAQWEYAATGPVHLKYPWGNSPDPTCSNNTAVFNEAGGTGGYGCSQGGTWKVGSKTAGAAWSGALDMSGNLREWSEDSHHVSYTGAPADGSAWVDNGSNRVLRGGSFRDGAAYMRAAERSGSTPGARSAYLGARCWRP